MHISAINTMTNLNSNINKNPSINLDRYNGRILLDELGLLDNSISVFVGDTQKNLKHCFKFAEEKHNGQYYIWLNHEKLSYVFHISNVARNALFIKNDHLLAIIAFWHDLIEDERCKESELIEKIECLGLADNKELIIVALHNLNRKNFVCSKDYYLAVCSNKYSLIVKSADLLSNLNTCLVRFDEMRDDGTINWIYDYLFEVENFLFGNIDFIHNKNSFLIKEKLNEIILQINAKFSVSEKNDFIKFCEEMKNGKNQ